MRTPKAKWLSKAQVEHLLGRISARGAENYGTARRFAEAIPVGVEIPDLVLAKLLRWTLVSEPLGVVNATEDAEALLNPTIFVPSLDATVTD